MKKNNSLLIAIIAILAGFLISTILLLLTNRNPLLMFNAIIQAITGYSIKAASFNSRHIGEFIIQTMPILLTGLSVGFAFRTGLFNIGAEGQMIMGSVGAILAAVYFKAPLGIHIVIVVLSGILAGAIWGLIPGFLRARFNVHEVVTTIMLNYVALFFNNWFMLNVIGTLDGIKTENLPKSALLQSAFLSDITNNSRLNWGFIPVIISIVLYWFIIEKTSFGFSLRAVGLNKDAAKNSGMKVERNIVFSMTIAGAFAGLAGAVFAVGTYNYGRVLIASEGYGFDGIAVALVGANTGIGILFAGLLFGALKSAQLLMQIQGIPKDISSIIQGLVVLFVSMRYGIVYILSKYKMRQNRIEMKRTGQ